MKKPNFKAMSQSRPPLPENLQEATETLRQLYDMIESLQETVDQREATHAGGEHIRLLGKFRHPL